MRDTGPSSADEMVAAFLRAEIDSDRWGDDHVRPGLAAHGWPTTLVEDPDTTDADANINRARILTEYRGWQDNRWLFEGFPNDVEWRRAELEPTDVAEVLGAGFPTWLLLSGGSRRVVDCAAAARTGPLPTLPMGEARVHVAEAAMRSHWVARRYALGELLGPPILVAPWSRAPLVAIEGHTRLIGWSLATRPEPLPVILGLSDSLARWKWF